MGVRNLGGPVYTDPPKFRRSFNNERASKTLRLKIGFH